MFEREQQVIEATVRGYCSDTGLPDPGKLKWNPIPFSGEWGISTSFFQLAAQEARSNDDGPTKLPPVQIRAQEIASGIAVQLDTPPGFSRVEAVNGYLNLYFSTSEYSSRVINDVLNEGEKFGCDDPKGELIMVEFSQPNTHKAFHVGHLRNVIVGSTICNILECAGYGVVRANYIGDIGWHVIKWLWNYLNYHNGEVPGDDKTRWMGDIYTEADNRLEDHPEFEPEVRALFSRWDNRDPEIVALWEKTREWSLEGFEQIYNLLDVNFDRRYYESEVEEPGKALVDDLIQSGIAVDERPDGPVIIRLDDLLGLEKEKYRVLVILRSDGTSLYASKDLPLAIQKFQEYDLKRSIYVIDVRQSFYMQQIYKTLEIMGHPWAKDCYHLAYEIVNLPGNVTMSSRDGTVVLLEDLIREATERAYQIVDEKNPVLSEERKLQVSQAVALGALKYTMLARDNVKIVTFDWESALDFDGQAAPYIQYAHVRANSILRRMDGSFPDPLKPEYELHPSEIQLIDLISRIPGDVQRAAAEYKTIHLTNLAYEIARAFSDFYNQCPVLKAEPDVRAFRLRLVATSRQAIANLLNILGINAPEIM
ncbi:arginine--tRNA ligase [Chloroflexota bacterium]